MAAGRTGAITTLLVYGLFFNFVRPNNINSLKKPVGINPLPSFYRYGKYANNADLLGQQTNNGMANFGYGKHTLTVRFIFPSLYKSVKKRRKTTTRLRHSDALIIMICLMLSGDIHPCPGPLHTNPGKEVNTTVDVTCNTSISQVRSYCSDKSLLGHVQQSNLARRLCTSGHVGVLPPARSVVPGVRVAAAGLLGAGVAQTGADGCQGGRAGELRRKDCGDGGPASRARRGCVGGSSRFDTGDGTALTRMLNVPAMVDSGLTKPRVIEKTVLNVNRKVVNPAIIKNRKWEVFQTVNHSRTVWDSKVKPRGILGGHLNIRSINMKSLQVHHLLTDSNLDFLCLCETWLKESSPSAASNVSGFKSFRRDRVGSKGGGVMIYVKDNIQCNEICWSNCKELECIGLNIILSPQMSFFLIVIYQPSSSNSSFYEHFQNLLRECNFNKEVIIMGDFYINWMDKAIRKKLK